MFRQLNKTQLNVLALSYITSLIEKNKTDWMLQEMQKELTYELIYHHGITFDNFNNAPKTFNISQEFSKDNLSSTDLALAQKEVASFYLNAFCSKKNDVNLKQIFADASIKAEKQKTEDALSYTKRQEIEERKENAIRKDGIVCKNGKAIVLDPVYAILDSDWQEDILKSENEKIEIDQYIKEYLNKNINNASLVSSNNLTSNDVNNYNIISLYKEMIQEILTKNVCELMPLSNEFKKLSEKNNIQLICVPGFYRLNTVWYYSMKFFDLTKNELIYGYSKTISGPSAAKSSIIKDLLILKF